MLPMITMRKSAHGFPLLYYRCMGLYLATLSGHQIYAMKITNYRHYLFSLMSFREMMCSCCYWLRLWEHLMINDYHSLYIYNSWSCRSVELSLQLSGSSFLMHSVCHWEAVWIWRVLFITWLCDGLSECTKGCVNGYPHLVMLHIETRLFSRSKLFVSTIGDLWMKVQ